MTSYAHGREDINKVVNVKTVKDGRQNSSPSYSNLDAKPFTQFVSPANPASEVGIPRNYDIQEDDGDVALEKLEE